MTAQRESPLLTQIRQILFSDSLKGKFARGGLLLSGASMFEIGFRFVRNIILTRLLVSELFGLMATIYMLIAFFEAFTEVGVRQVVIQNKKGSTDDFLNVAWWFSCIRGLLLFAIAFLGTPAICAFYEKPELLMPLRVAFTALFFTGAASPRMYVLEKEFNYFKWIVIKQGAGILGVAFAIILSIWLRNIWPLVLGLVVEYAGTFLFSHVLVPFRPQFRIDRVCLREIWQYARGMIGLPVLAFIFFNFDIFFLGKLCAKGFCTWDEVGWYSVAKGFAMVLVVAFSKTVGPLLVPTFSKLQETPERLREALLKLTELVSLISLPCVAFCAVFAKPLLEILYTEEYGNAAAAFVFLMFFVFFRLLGMILMSLYLALAKQRTYRILALARVVVVLAAVYPAIKAFGLTGAAATVFLGMAGMVVVQLVYALKLIDLKASDYYATCLARPLAYSLIIIVPGAGVRLLLGESGWIQLGCGLLLCATAWAFIVTSRRFRATVIELGT